MIRFSAALVAVAIGVLIGGIATSKLLLVYVAILISAVALIALAIGIVRKREELFGDGQAFVPATAGASPGLPVSADDSERIGRGGRVASPPPSPVSETAVTDLGQSQYGRYAYSNDGQHASPGRSGYRPDAARQGAGGYTPANPAAPWETRTSPEPWSPPGRDRDGQPSWAASGGVTSGGVASGGVASGGVTSGGVTSGGNNDPRPPWSPGHRGDDRSAASWQLLPGFTPGADTLGADGGGSPAASGAPGTGYASDAGTPAGTGRHAAAPPPPAPPEAGTARPAPAAWTAPAAPPAPSRPAPSRPAPPEPAPPAPPRPAPSWPGVGSGGWGADSPGWFDRPGRAAGNAGDVPAPPAAVEPPTRPWEQPTVASVTPAGPTSATAPAEPADAVAGEDVDEDWPTRYSWLDEDESGEPTDPEPTDPEPTDPEPTDPEPTDPELTDKEPADRHPEPAAAEEPADPAEPAALEPVAATGPADAYSADTYDTDSADIAASGDSGDSDNADTSASAVPDGPPAAAEADPADSTSDDHISDGHISADRTSADYIGDDNDRDASANDAPADDATSADTAATDESTADESTADDSAADGAGNSDRTSRPGRTTLVTVVPGVPRYHEGDCILIRFMADDDVQKVTVAAAKATGCTPCAACQPED